MLPLLLATLALFPTADDRAINDAPLNAVKFVDRNEGWAAGADGVMWHTIDGGATWERQTLPTKGTIHALQFLTPYTGYAAGREEVQATGQSAGLLFVTRDGGLTWNRVNTAELPGLHAVNFSDDKSGVVGAVKGGPYRTVDGGQKWAPLSARMNITGKDVATFGDVALVGLVGIMLNGGGCIPHHDDEKLPPSGRVLAVAGNKLFSVAVGQCGVVKIIEDARRKEQPIFGLPTQFLAACDFRGTCCHGDHIWVVGSPGTFVAHSVDRGMTWQCTPTGQSIPLNAVHFIDDRTGWAVGELGTILATTDGGATWKVQRRGGQRAAIMCIHAQDRNSPLDLLARFGAADGYLINCVAVTSDETAIPRSQRLATAVRKSGGSSSDTIYGFDVPKHLEASDSDRLLTDWNQRHGTRATDVLVRRIVLHLRTWQPEVVICDFAGGPAESLVVEAVQTAVKQAADPAAFPEHLQVGKLSAWQVKKVFGLWDGPGAAHVTVRTDDTVPALGESPRDHANKVVGLIAEKASLPKSRGLRLLAHNMPGGAGLNGIMDGIILAPGGTGRRAVVENPRDVKEPDDKHVRELQNLANIAQSGLPQVGDPAAILANVGKTLDKMPAEQGLRSILAIANRAAQSGNWPMAKETYELAVGRYPGQPAGHEAICWLLRYYSSSEARRRHDSQQSISVTRADFASAANKRPLFDPNDSVQPLTNPAINLTQKTLTDSATTRKWYQGALALETKLSALGPAIINDPTIQFPLAAAKRQLGDNDAGKAFFRKTLAEQSTNEAWRVAARQELWVTDRMGQPPRFAAICCKSSKRPHLDAVFDDECWTDVPSLSTQQATGDMEGYSTTTRFAYDDEFLYIALECQHPEAGFRPKVGRRERDADVSPYDRVEVLMDLDRDYATCYRFRIDQRGALAEDCWDDANWNPRWYVAFKSSPGGYAAEIAIHLSDLTVELNPSGKVWAMNTVRIVPGRGMQAAAMPADVTPRPEACGLLMFAEPNQK